jgi:hypothetical protein
MPQKELCGDAIEVRSAKLSITDTSTFLIYRPMAGSGSHHHPPHDAAAKEACILVFPFQVKRIWWEKRKRFSKGLVFSSFLHFLCILFSGAERCGPAIIINKGRAPFAGRPMAVGVTVVLTWLPLSSYKRVPMPAVVPWGLERAVSWSCADWAPRMAGRVDAVHQCRLVLDLSTSCPCTDGYWQIPPWK